MALNSINTNIGAYYAQSNIGKSSDMASLSIARLSSGERIVRAADDVAAMSAGTSLRTNVTTLRMALINTSQGSSLLQVADGALSQITDILQRQKAISVQAGSGSLTSQERSFLNQEFQNLSSEIDRLVGQTNFNGVTLLDGSLSEKVDLTDVKDAATSASASITVSTDAGDGDLLVLNGATFEADNNAAAANGTAYSIGGTIQETLDNLVTVLNASTNTAISQATYTRSGNSLVITADNGGSQGEVYTIDAANSTAINGAGTGVGVVNGEGASNVVNLFSGNNIAVDSITDVAAATNGNTTANIPFEVGETLTIATNGGGAVNVVTIAANDTIETIVNRINAGTPTHGYTARVVGNSGAYNIQFETSILTTDGSYQTGNQASITFGGLANTIGANGVNDAFNAAFETVANGTSFTYNLFGGDDLGIGAGDTLGVGVIGDNLLTDQTQLKSEVSIIFPDIADGDLLTTANFGQNPPVQFSVGGVTFFFTELGNAPTEAQVGDTLEDTLDSMVATFNDYAGSQENNYILNQLEAVREGNAITFRSRDVGTVVDSAGAIATISYGNGANPTVTGSSITNATAGVANLNTGQTGGVTTAGVTNSAFVGQITGFTATYGGTANTIDINVTVGEFSYVAQNVTTNPTGANQTVRFSSQDGGGYFDIQMASNNGETVSTQAQADVFAQRLNAAFESLSFYQNREISSFTGSAPIITEGQVTGTLIGTSFELQTTDFSDVNIDYIRVNAPQGSSENGSITISIDGEEYTTVNNIGDQLGANAVIEFTNELDASKVLTFNTGDIAIEFDTDAKAAALQEALESAFGVGDGSAQLNFQVGTTTSDTLQVGLNNVSTLKLYGGLQLDVLTAENAAIASDQLDIAIDIVTSVRAEVGALQSRFDFASANVESSIQNQDAARGVLLDTDIAAESTQFATAQVQLQAGIAVLAQANLLPQNLLKLIG